MFAFILRYGTESGHTFSHLLWVPYSAVGGEESESKGEKAHNFFSTGSRFYQERVIDR